MYRYGPNALEDATEWKDKVVVCLDMVRKDTISIVQNPLTKPQLLVIVDHHKENLKEVFPNELPGLLDVAWSQAPMTIEIPNDGVTIYCASGPAFCGSSLLFSIMQNGGHAFGMSAKYWQTIVDITTKVDNGLYHMLTLEEKQIQATLTTPSLMKQIHATHLHHQKDADASKSIDVPIEVQVLTHFTTTLDLLRGLGHTELEWRKREVDSYVCIESFGYRVWKWFDILFGKPNLKCV
jgi:hypothetical protein